MARGPRPDLAARNRANATHGMSDTPTAKTWSGMKRRCAVPHDKDYPNYGGRGIKVCDRWAGSFAAFLEDMGVKPAGMTLGRIDNDGNYEPGNCRWETTRQQNNNRRSSRPVTALGETKTVAEWARALGTSPETISHRLKSGWPADIAVSTPTDKRNRYAAPHHQGE